MTAVERAGTGWNAFLVKAVHGHGGSVSTEARLVVLKSGSTRTIARFPVDVGAHKTRLVPDELRPSTVDDVIDVARHAAFSGTPIFPISTGRNWGMGSRSPVVDGSVVVDLSSLDRICSVDLESGVAVIEPGCTQRQLSDALAGTSWMLNVTSACADTSVIGNALERGDGALRSRTHDVLGVEAVLADGAVIRTGGLGADRSYRGRIVGPDLTQLFVQSNLGIVTAMAVSLIPRPERISLVRADVPNADAADVVQTVGAFARSGPAGALRLHGLCLVPASGESTLPPGTDSERCMLTGPLYGSAPAVDLSARLLRQTLEDRYDIEDVSVVDAATIAPDDARYAHALVAQGIPTCRIVRSVLNVTSCDEVDTGANGFLVFLPTLRLQADKARHDIQVFQQLADKYSTALSLDWRLHYAHSANGMARILFDRGDSAATKRAHQLREEATSRFVRAGRPPYRSNIDHSWSDLRECADPSTISILERIKSCLDPSAAIAPGRYL
jgi:4-cresol dehydrogenase (hydroxylating)